MLSLTDSVLTQSDTSVPTIEQSSTVPSSSAEQSPHSLPRLCVISAARSIEQYATF